jgi:O-glycosyl hydrolase
MVRRTLRVEKNSLRLSRALTNDFPSGRHGGPQAYRAVLQRVTRIAPHVKVLVTFWQPRSSSKPKTEDWLDADSSQGYFLKPSLRGVNVVAVSVQNEPNYSVPGSQTCRWEPIVLAEFIVKMLAPRLGQSGLSVELAAPDLAYVGEGASEAMRFHAVNKAKEVDVFSYQAWRRSIRGGPSHPASALRRRR